MVFNTKLTIMRKIKTTLYIGCGTEDIATGSELM